MVLPAIFTASLALSWSDWKAKHNRQYEASEDARRAGIFAANAKTVDAMNARGSRARFELNHFADLSPAEFRSKYLGFKGEAAKGVRRAENREAARVSGKAPTSYDWRTKSGVLAPVQDQGQCGSCWAFSATCNMESRLAIARGQRVNKLAEQALVDCEKNCGQYRFFNGCDAGCEGGLQPNAFKFGMSKGMPTEGSYPYTATDGTCQSFTSVANFTSWEFVSTDENQMAAYVAAHSPISVAVDASNWQFYSGGIIDAGGDVCATQDPNNPSLDHGVTVVGYTPDYWVVRNSWAASWGESGYVRLQFGQDTCGVALFACSAIP